jgi:hypothetical protein
MRQLGSLSCQIGRDEKSIKIIDQALKHMPDSGPFRAKVPAVFYECLLDGICPGLRRQGVRLHITL